MMNRPNTFTDIAVSSATPGNKVLHRQYVTHSLVEGIAFTTATTFKAVVQGFESALNDNIVNRVRAVKIISRDGQTVQATLIALGNAASVVEWNTALRALQYLTGETSGVNYTTVAGDRLLFELGYQDSAGLSISGTIRYGADKTATGDVAENETDTTATVRGWLETSADLVFEGDQSRAPILLTRPASPMLAGPPQLAYMEFEPAPPPSTGLGITVDTAGAVGIAGQAQSVAATSTPAAGAITLTGQAVSITVTSTPTSGAVTVAGQAQVVTAATTPAAGLITVAGQAVSLTVSTAPTSGALTVTGRSPALTVATTPGAGALTISGAGVTLTVSTSPGAGALVLTGQVPSLTLTTTPTAGAIVITGSAATLTVSASPSAGAMTFTGRAPSIVVSTTPSAGQITINGSTVNAGTGGISIDTPGQITVAGRAVTVAVSTTPVAGAMALTGQGVGLVVSPPVSAGALAVAGRAVSLAVLASLGAGQIVLSGSDVTAGTPTGTAPDFFEVSVPDRWVIEGVTLRWATSSVNRWKTQDASRRWSATVKERIS